MNKDELLKTAEEFSATFKALEQELGKVIVGMNDVVRLTLISICAGGHVLLEGVPGLGKTLLVKSIAKVLGLEFKRIQFTPDLMPSDITGTQVLTEDDSGKRNFVFKQGPIFANLVLADEINRATPKTQAALLEAMEERQVTVLDETHKLPVPFFVLATQNPVELEGTYPLPEAQLDRFMFKVIVPAPTSAQLKEILIRTTGVSNVELKPVFAPEASSTRISQFRDLVRGVVVADPIYEVLVRMISALTPGNSFATELTKKYVRFGPGPRGAQAILLASKVNALLDGRFNLSFEDIRSAFLPALRHRIILNFQADADSVTSDQIIEQVRNAK
jgi:MoxR-like ATPase